MSTTRLADEHWSKIYQFLCEHTRVYCRNEQAIRLFIEAVYWISRRWTPGKRAWQNKN